MDWKREADDAERVPLQCRECEFFEFDLLQCLIWRISFVINELKKITLGLQAFSEADMRCEHCNKAGGVNEQTKNTP